MSNRRMQSDHLCKGSMTLKHIRLQTAVTLLCLSLNVIVSAERSFKIENNRFVKDGVPIQIFSGSVHYQRIHPEYWRDRLTRVKALGLNAIQFYTTWNTHEPRPGIYDWGGFADVERFLSIANELDLMVFLRPGPYACGEWEFGGFPYWLASKQVEGGGTMTLRVSDPQYLKHVDKWWSVLLPKLTKHLYKNGGPIIMAQIENEYGFCWRGPDRNYLQFLVDKIHQYLDPDIIIYSTDPPYVIQNGTIPGSSVYSVVDFGPGLNVEYAFKAQALQNAPNLSPPLNSEYYTGWITNWGDKMANTSSWLILKTLNEIVNYANRTGSVNLYMAHGGTNFGYWAGANIQSADPTPPGLEGKTSRPDIYKPTITSYDYDCPVSESGRIGQPGIGGPNKFLLIRDVFSRATGNQPIDFPEYLPLRDFGEVQLKESVTLLHALKDLHPGEGVYSKSPERMENYNQAGGFTVYRTKLQTSLFENGDVSLDIGGPVHDYAQVILEGEVIGILERNVPRNVTIKRPKDLSTRRQLQLDIIVHALGRVNFGCIWDFKGLVHGALLINGQALHDWTVFPLELFNIGNVTYPKVKTQANVATLPRDAGPVIYRGYFSVDANTPRSHLGHLPDTYINMRNWSKGLVFINTFNLGWYWPRVGPQGAQYIPGPLLRTGQNEIIIVEVEDNSRPAASNSIPSAYLTGAPDFSGKNKDAKSDSAQRNKYQLKIS